MKFFLVFFACDQIQNEWYAVLKQESSAIILSACYRNKLQEINKGVLEIFASEYKHLFRA